jgi:hypothetical protein
MICYSIANGGERQRAYPRGEHIMSKAFAEKIIDSMVDENGHCGERGLSAKQFTILSDGLAEGEWEYVTSWQGDYGRKDFYAKDFIGNVGKYRVELNWYAHFNDRYTVKSIDLRDPEEYQAELDAEAKLKAMRDFSGSEWVAEPKRRLDLTLTLVNDYVYEGCSYSYYDDGTRHIYTFRDADGNCFVWKTQKVIDCYDEQTEEWTDAEVGDTIVMKATVKEHSEYKGTKQTVITRPKIAAICKVA